LKLEITTNQDPHPDPDRQTQRRLELLDRRDEIEERLKGFLRFPSSSWVVWPLTAVGAAGVTWWGLTRGEWAEAVFVALLLVLSIGGYYTLLALGIQQSKRELDQVEDELERLDSSPPDEPAT